MNRSVLVFGSLLFVGLSFWCFGCSKDLPPPVTPIEGATSKVAWLDSASFDTLVAVEGRIAMVDFFNSSCPASRQMEKSVSDICDEYSNRALVGKVNVAQERSLAIDHNITHVPTFVFFADGLEAARKVGIMHTDSLSVVLDSLLVDR